MRREVPEERGKLMSLVDPVTKRKVAFSVYKDSELPFMSKKGGLMARHIHDANADDDVQTDDECRENASRMQKRNLQKAVTRFVEESPTWSC